MPRSGAGHLRSPPDLESHFPATTSRESGFPATSRGTPGHAGPPPTATGPGAGGDAGSVRRVASSMRPWDAAALRAALVEPAGPWARLDVADRVGSTNPEAPAGRGG